MKHRIVFAAAVVLVLIAQPMAATVCAFQCLAMRSADRQSHHCAAANVDATAASLTSSALPCNHALGAAAVLIERQDTPSPGGALLLDRAPAAEGIALFTERECAGVGCGPPGGTAAFRPLRI